MWAMLSGTRHLKRPKLCGGVQELMQVCTPSSEWGICVLDLRRWCDCESHYDLRCVDCQGHFDVNCSKWRSHFDVACRIFVSLLLGMFKFCKGWRKNVVWQAPLSPRSPSSPRHPLPALIHSTESRTVPASLLPPMSSPTGTTRASLLRSSNCARDSLTRPRQT